MLPVSARRLAVPFVTVLLLGVVLRSTDGAPLDPNAFPSLGTLNVTGGSITINTNTLAITGAAAFNGGTVSQGVGNPEVAVFTFSNFNIGPGVTINIVGSRPLALLSQGTMGIASAISINGGDASGVTAGGAGPAGGYAGGTGESGTAGGGPGGGTGTGFTHGGAGGGYGGAGGAGALGGGSSIGGVAYGDLTTLLQGGSGGGGAALNGGGGGGGGGAIELGALGTLTLSAALTSNGGQAGSVTDEGGGGAGGGILLHAPTYSLASLSALGGLGSVNFSSSGGGGGGGRIALTGGQISLPQISSLSASVHGGIAQPAAGAAVGKAGVLTFKPDRLDVQAGQTANIGITAGQTGRTDARIELLPTSFSVLGGGTASLVPTGTYIQPAGGSINIAGGQFNVTANLQISAGATLNLSSGTLNLGAGTTLIVNGRAAFSQPFEISNLAAVQITAGGDLTSNSAFDIANSNANGQLFVSGAGSTINTPAGAIWGLTPSNSATVTFASGGAGTFGTVIMSGQGGTTSLSLQSNGQMTTTFGLRAGPSIGSGSTTINIAGGTLNNLGTADFRGGTRVNLSVGGLILSNGGTFSPGSTLNWTGGTINLAAGRTLAFDGGAGSTSVGGVSLPNGSTLRISNGGRFDAGGILNIAATAGTTGTLFVDGANSRFTTGPSFQFWANGTGSAATVTFSNQGAGTFDSLALAAAGGGQGLLNILSGGSVRATNFIAGSSTGAATINLAGTLNVGSMTLAGPSILNFNSGSFNSTGTAGFANTAQMLFSAGRNKVARVGALAFSGTGRVDLSDNALIVDYAGTSQFTIVRNQITTGRSGGTWLGNALTSSAAAVDANFALALVEATDIGSPTTFLGQPIDDTSVLVRYTYVGDNNLDGSVNLADFSLLGANFNAVGSTWFRGDYNYSGSTEIGDFSLLAANYNRSLPAPSARPGPIPEPSVVFPVLGTILIGHRRRAIRSE